MNKYLAGLGSFLLVFTALLAYPAEADTCSFSRNLFLSVVGTDVKCLQQYLNATGYTVATSGVGSPGKESTYYGDKTSLAVARWQTANGISPATGYFGSYSRTIYYGLISKTSAAPSVSLFADFFQVEPGGAVIIRWSSANTSSCSIVINGKTYTGTASAGGVSTGPLYTATTYTINCTGLAGGTATNSTTINVNPSTVNLSANPTSISSGKSVLLTLTTTKVENCTAGQQTSGTTDAAGGWTLKSGFERVNATYIKYVFPTKTTTYSIGCVNTAGSIFKSNSVTVTVGSTAPTAAISASSASVSSGGSVVLTSTCTNSSVYMVRSGDLLTTYASGAYSAPVSTTITGITTSSTYTLTCVGSNDANDSKSVTVTVSSTAPTATLKCSSGTSTANSDGPCTADSTTGYATVSWSSTNATHCSVPTEGWTYLDKQGSFSSKFTSSKTFTLNCTASDGTTATDNITINVGATTDTTAPTTTASPAGGTYNSTQSITLTCSDGSGSGCDKIYYTTDGTTPTTASSVYSSAINISSTKTLKFFAKDKSGNSEAVKSASYTITTTTTPAPTATITASKVSGSGFNGSATLTSTCTNSKSATVTRGSYGASGTSYYSMGAYSAPFNVTVNNIDTTNIPTYTLTCFSGDNWQGDKVTASVTPSLDTPTTLADTTPPTTTVSPAGGSYSSTQYVSLTCSDGTGVGCHKIYYTTDGTTPTSSSYVYSNLLHISSNTTLKFFAVDLSGNSEAVKSASYTITTTTTPAPTATISVNPASISSGSYSTITLTTTNVTSCTAATGVSYNLSNWTLQGQTAMEEFAYTIKVYPTATQSYSITCQNSAGVSVTSNIVYVYVSAPADTTPPTTTVSPAGGTYNSAQSVTLTCSDGSGSGCDKIYYTTDGATPTTASSVYSSAISVSSTKTLKFFAKDKSGNSETVKSVSYTIPAKADIMCSFGSTMSSSQCVVNLNDTVTISWSTSNVTSCSITKPGGGVVSAAIPTGSFQTGSFTAGPYTWRLDCKDASGASISDTVMGSVFAPKVTISSNSYSVPSTGTATISWSSTNATSCSVNKTVSGSTVTGWATGTSGSKIAIDFTNLAPKIFTITCTGPGGSATQSIAVTVSPTSFIDWAVGTASALWTWLW